MGFMWGQGIAMLLAGFVVAGTPPNLAAAQQRAAKTENEASDQARAPHSATLLESDDALVLKNGRTVRGIRVVQEFPSHLLIRVPNTSVELRIARSQVDRIQYAEHAARGAGRTHSAQPGDDETSTTEVAGLRLSSHLHRQLRAELGNLSLADLGRRDFVHILNTIARRLAVDISIDNSVHELPVAERMWELPRRSGLTLLAVLRDELPRDIPGMTAAYEYDTVVVSIEQPQGMHGESHAPPGDDQTLSASAGEGSGARKPGASP